MCVQNQRGPVAAQGIRAVRMCQIGGMNTPRCPKCHGISDRPATGYTFCPITLGAILIHRDTMLSEWVSAVSVVLARPYLAYLCSSAPETRSSVVEIPRVVLAVSNLFAHR